ncbi:Carboxypeptidase regulatory-like domain protein [uncultured archaeon]|nr:Carboxypeptidase regulatory-like domain protein [uncultured archaeon]
MINKTLDRIKSLNRIRTSLLLGIFFIFSIFFIQTVAADCTTCHTSYGDAVSSSKHSPVNPGTPVCTDCHTGYVDGHSYIGYVVNESNTCRNSGCHEQDVNGFYERHSSKSDCTQCHFANTTRPFSLNGSLFEHDHNLTVEHNFYQYNQSGMPLKSNGGVGVGMFPYYTCTLTCHGSGNQKIDEAANSWLGSAHARSLHMSGDNKQSCAKCKSPFNYNVSLPSGTLISQPDWQGIQCRVCHNLHKRNVSTSGPIAYYNETSSSLNGYAIYEPVSNATQLCEKCHTGTTHNSQFGGTHKNVVGFDCASCHLNTTFNKNETHMFEVKNTTTGVTGCEVCHKAEDHTFQFSANHTGKATCEACHDKTVARNATGYAVSSDGKTYGLYNDTLTGEISSWKDSHGTPATWPLHNISKEVNCAKCHMTKSKSTGTLLAGSILAHTGSGTCDECHVVTPGSGFTLPATNVCKTCHTTYADQYGAPNLTGTVMAGYSSCGGNNCHKGVSGTTTIATVADHNIDRNYSGGGIVTYTVFLNGQNSLTITQGTTPVTIRSNISDAGSAGKVAAAQFQLRNSTNKILIDWTAMSALDGKFDAINGVWESITGSIDTTAMPAGTYTIYVRGMDIGKQWSTTQSATLNIISAPAFTLSGKVTDASGNAISGARVELVEYSQVYNNLTNSLGDYSMQVPGGTYHFSASASGYALNTTTVTINADSIQDFTLVPVSGIFIPWIAYSQTTWYTPVQVQNIGTIASDVNVSMYDQNGNLVQIQNTTIQPKTSAVFWPSAGPTDGGSAVIASTQSVIAIVNEMPKNGLDGMSYGGFAQGSTKLYIPWIAYSQTTWYTPIQVQNIGTVASDVNVSMYDQNGNLVQIQNATIQPKTASVFWPPAGPTDGGSAVITSTQDVVAIVNEMSKTGSQSMSYEGFQTGSKKTFIPVISFSQTNTYTPIQVQNVGTASASVNVNIYDSNGAFVVTQNAIIQPNTSAVFWPPAASTPSGSAVIESNEDVIAIVNEMINNNNWAMSYYGFSAGSTQVFIPWIAYGSSGWSTPVYVQNAGTSGANVAVSFYDQNGGLVETRNGNILANASQIFVPRSSAPTAGGSVMITSLQPVTAAVHEIDAASKVAMAYSGKSG